MILGIIPSRYASTRFPAKPLVNINGMSMIERVFRQAKQAKSLSRVVVATDDSRIFDHVKSFGGEVVMTDPAHPSGTDRCYETLVKVQGKYRYVLNIQGDEPFIYPEQIDELAVLLQNENTELATLIIPVNDVETLHSTTDVKVVVNSNMEALYFSRQAIPFLKGIGKNEWTKHFTYYRHVGMYAYRSDVLEKISKLSPSLLEKAESLEQLRWLENGLTIKCGVTMFESYSIDTPEDIEKALKLKKQG